MLRVVVIVHIWNVTYTKKIINKHSLSHEDEKNSGSKEMLEEEAWCM